jgi:hypothetical protein
MIKVLKATAKVSGLLQKYSDFRKVREVAKEDLVRKLADEIMNDENIQIEHDYDLNWDTNTYSVKLRTISEDDYEAIRASLDTLNRRING